MSWGRNVTVQYTNPILPKPAHLFLGGGLRRATEREFMFHTVQGEKIRLLFKNCRFTNAWRFFVGEGDRDGGRGGGGKPSFKDGMDSYAG